MTVPARGEVWTVNLDPTRGHEQSGKRPALIVSVDLFNQGPAGLVVLLPITSHDKNIPLHVRIDPPGGGLRMTSFAKCEDIRSVSTERLVKRLGKATSHIMAEVEDRLRILLNL